MSRVESPTKEVSPEHAKMVALNYKITEKILLRGFLAITAVYAGVPICIRTITGRELDLLSFRTKHLSTYHRDIEILTQSIFAIKGILVRASEEDSLREFVSSTLTANVRSKLVAAFFKLRRVYNESISYVEGFSYTSRSSNLWEFLRGKDLMSPTVTGNKITAEMGIGDHQAMWTLLMSYADKEYTTDKEIQNALLITSATNSKGAKESGDRRKSMQDNLDEERELIVKFGNRSFLKDGKKSKSAEGWSVIPVTRDEMTAEIRRIASGENDKHDQYFEDYFKRKQKEAQDKWEAVQLAQEEEIAKRAREGKKMYGSMVMSPEELAQYQSGSPDTISVLGKTIIGGKK